MMMELSMFPVDKGEHLSEYVARVLAVIDQSGISYRLNPMGTVLEGEWDEVMKVIKTCHAELERDCSRISTSLKIDYHKDTASRMDAKIKSVEDRIGRPLKK